MAKSKIVTVVVLGEIDNANGRLTISTLGTRAAPASKIVQWTLTWGDGTTEHGENTPPTTVAHTYITSKTYTVELTIQTNKGQMARGSLTSSIFVVPPTPIPPGTTPPPDPVPSADCTAAPPALQIIDNSLAIWTFGPVAPVGYYILRNGVNTTGYGTIIKISDGDIWVKGGDGNWWRWNGTGYDTGVAQDPCDATPPPPGGQDFGGYRFQMYPQYGMESKGGRGDGLITPRIYRVTEYTDTGAAATLNADGTYSGEYRAALEGNPWNGPRFVIFEISGYIDIHADLNITNPYVTVAGQTAPSPGITIRSVDNGTASEAMHLFNAHDMVLQHYRIRPGWYAGGASPSICNSGVQLYPPTGHYNIVFDHMTCSWHQDEGIALGYGLSGAINGGYTNATIWRSLIYEGLVAAPGSGICSGGGVSGGHGVGGANGKGFAMIQSITAHNRERNPWWSNAWGFLANNVIYNWAAQWGHVFSDSTDIGYPGTINITAIGNRFIVGSEGPANGFNYLYWINSFGSTVAGHEIYLNDNTVDQAAYPAVAVTEFQNDLPYDPRVVSPPAGAPIPAGYSAIASTDTEAFVKLHAGARPLDRDTADTRIINEITDRTGGVITNHDAVGGYPTLAANMRSLIIPANPWDIMDAVGRTRFEYWLEEYAQALEPST